MHIWKNEKLRSKYDLFRYMAKNDGLMKFTDDELNFTDVKAKPFQGVKEQSVKRLLELAFVIGRLQGMEAADKELDREPEKSESSDNRTGTNKNQQTGSNMSGVTTNGMRNSNKPVGTTNSRQKSNTGEKSNEKTEEIFSEEKLYVVVCKVKNRQDKTTYVTHCVRTKSEEQALSAAATESGMRNQTLLKGKVIKSYTSDSMQFQFGIGQKETDSLTILGKKYL